MMQDLAKILETVLPSDPSFRAVKPEEIDLCIDKARQHARSNAKDDFLLSLMRLMALPGNGHTRLIPNGAISVLPLRFATIGDAVRLLDAPSDQKEYVGGELVAINAVALDEIEAAAQEYLAGTAQRKRVIGPILFVWPRALVRLGLFSGRGTIAYKLRNSAGQTKTLAMDTANLVPGAAFYPRNEHGKTDPLWSSKAFVEIRDFGDFGLMVALPSFFDPSETQLTTAMSEAANAVRLRPKAPIVVDIRGNTGGNFLRCLPLIDAISGGATDRKVGVLVDKFTFSAAIVFVAILKHRLGPRLALIGEEMGDGLTFFAEGGTMELSTAGAAVRYSTAFHDWAGGTTDETTPGEIATELVAAGALALSQRWIATSGNSELQDQICLDMLGKLGRNGRS